MTRKLTPYQRIVRNAAKGRGVVLSAEEVWVLAGDSAIETRAEVDDMSDDAPRRSVEVPEPAYEEGVDGVLRAESKPWWTRPPRGRTGGRGRVRDDVAR